MFLRPTPSVCLSLLRSAVRIRLCTRPDGEKVTPKWCSNTHRPARIYAFILTILLRQRKFKKNTKETPPLLSAAKVCFSSSPLFIVRQLFSVIRRRSNSSRVPLSPSLSLPLSSSIPIYLLWLSFLLDELLAVLWQRSEKNNIRLRLRTRETNTTPPPPHPRAATRSVTRSVRLAQSHAQSLAQPRLNIPSLRNVGLDHTVRPLSTSTPLVLATTVGTPTTSQGDSQKPFCLFFFWRRRLGYQTKRYPSLTHSCCKK